MANSKRKIGGKTPMLFIGCVLIVLVLLIILGLSSFESIAEDLQVRQVTTDDLGHYFVLSQNHELYIGGENGDRFGFYKTGFRWGFLYGLRNLFRETSPVLFTKNVSKVFPCQCGLLYSDIDGSLYYFGELNGGKTIKVADSILDASGTNYGIVYLDSNNSVYYTTWDSKRCSWTEALLVSKNVSAIYFRQLYLWQLSLDGVVSLSFIRDPQSFALTDIVELSHDINQMWNGQNNALLQRDDGVYLLVTHQEFQKPIINELRNWNANSHDPDRVLADADLRGPFPGNYLLSKQGNVYQIKDDSAILVRSLEGQSFVDLAVHGEQKTIYVVDNRGVLVILREID